MIAATKLGEKLRKATDADPELYDARQECEGIRQSFLRDFEGRNMTIRQIRQDKSPAPLIPKGPGPGRPVEPYGRVIRDFKDVHGWSWETCAAALFVSGKAKRSYDELRRAFRDWVRANGE